MSARASKRVIPREGIVLRLYVAGNGPNSVAARDNLRTVLARHPGEAIHLEIVDVVEDPDRGLGDGVVVTPMLHKVSPPPARRIVGNLRDEAVLLAVLDLRKDEKDGT
jgi:circadian clock protein KaiB